jgi:hypothetical protein
MHVHVLDFCEQELICLLMPSSVTAHLLHLSCIPCMLASAGATPLYAFRGCVTDETLFGPSRHYFGDTTAVNFNLAVQLAGSRFDKVMALARNSVSDGYGFTFDQDPPFSLGSINIPGCKTPCVDDQTKYCGSWDYFSSTPGSMQPVVKNRVWAVYHRGKGSATARGISAGGFLYLSVVAGLLG